MSIAFANGSLRSRPGRDPILPDAPQKQGVEMAVQASQSKGTKAWFFALSRIISAKRTSRIPACSGASNGAPSTKCRRKPSQPYGKGFRWEEHTAELKSIIRIRYDVSL